MLKIHVNHNGQNEGPYPLEVIQEKLLKGELSTSDWVWWKGQKNWTHIAELPGIELPEKPPVVERAQASTPVEDEPAAPGDQKQTSKEAPSPNTPEEEGLTIPDFQIEFAIWISAGWYWLRNLSWRHLETNLMAFIPVLLVLVLMVSTQSNALTTLYSLILPVLMGPWNWVIMEEFRGHSPRPQDLIAAYGRAPVKLLCLGAVNLIPMIFFPFFENPQDASLLVMPCSMILSLYLFYSTNLVVDKKVSFPNAIAFSIQAVHRNVLPMMLYVLLTGVIGISGFLFMGIGVIATGLIAYTSTVFAYLWVFSRKSLEEEATSSHE